jgi:hypothetical protein
MCVALALSIPAETRAQVDTTRRDTSQVRIPIRKDLTGTITRRESGGDVASVTMMRIDSLEAVARDYRTRLDSLETANAGAASRTAALEARINALADSLAGTRTEIAVLREELAATNARVADVDTRLQGLNQRFNNFRNRSLFGNSGFYIGLGGGANYTTGTLREIGYESAPQLTVPIGWHKRGSLLGIRTEWSTQRLEGVQTGSYFNPDPTIFSGTGMLTVAFPLNDGKTNNFYVMGGGGFYMFRNFGAASGLADKFSGSVDGADTETKWGFNAGAGLEFHVLGASSLFVQSSMTNVAADRGTVGEEGRNLRWMPVVVGFMLR